MWGGVASDSGSLASFVEENAELKVDGADFFGTLLLGGLDESLLADPAGRKPKAIRFPLLRRLIVGHFRSSEGSKTLLIRGWVGPEAEQKDAGTTKK